MLKKALILQICVLFCFSQLECLVLIKDLKNTEKLGYNQSCITTNGEAEYLKKVLNPKMIVFDVGANKGEWSDAVMKIESGTRLFLFEPIPQVFADLSTVYAKKRNCSLYNFAFSDREGKETFYIYSHSPVSGFYSRPILNDKFRMKSKKIKVNTNTIDIFCVKNEVNQSDLLKIDTEGAEARVLRGAKHMIENNRISMIQFEYGGCYIDSGEKLEDLYSMFISNEYLVFRIFKDGLIHIHEWNEGLENFLLSNYLAVKKDYFAKAFPEYVNGESGDFSIKYDEQL